MRGRTSASTGGGLGFMGMLAVLFIGLKLAGIISWSWWWVLAPIWAPSAFALGVFTITFVVLALGTRRRRRNPRGW